MRSLEKKIVSDRLVIDYRDSETVAERDYSTPAAPGVSTQACHLARLIAGDGPMPTWLGAGIDNAMHALRWAIRDEELQPTRTTDRKRVEVLRDAARYIISALNDRSVMRVIDTLGGDDLAADNQAHTALPSLIARAEKALGAIPRGRGRHKSDVGAPSEAVCAMLVTVAWNGSRMRPPGHTAKRANEACNLLWEMAAGRPLPVNDNSAARWQENLRAAKRTLLDGDRDGLGWKASRLLGLPKPLGRAPKVAANRPYPTN